MCSQKKPKTDQMYHGHITSGILYMNVSCLNTLIVWKFLYRSRSACYPQKSMRYFPPLIPIDIDTDCSVQNTEDLTTFDDLAPDLPVGQSGGGMPANDLLNLPLPLVIIPKSTNRCIRIKRQQAHIAPHIS